MPTRTGTLRDAFTLAGDGPGGGRAASARCHTGCTGAALRRSGTSRPATNRVGRPGWRRVRQGRPRPVRTPRRAGFRRCRGRPHVNVPKLPPTFTVAGTLRSPTRYHGEHESCRWSPPDRGGGAVRPGRATAADRRKDTDRVRLQAVA